MDCLDDEVQRLRQVLNGGQVLEVIDVINVVGEGVPDGPIPSDSVQRAISIQAQMGEIEDAITRHMRDVERKLGQATQIDCAPMYLDAHY